MDIDFPIIDWFEEPVKKSISSVFHGVNEFVESLDLFRRYRSAHFELLQPQVNTIKILGMQHPIELHRVYHPTVVSTDIRRRVYKPEWGKIEGSAAKAAKTESRNSEYGDRFIEKNQRTVVLGGPGAGKTTFLRFLALAYLDKEIFARSQLKRSLLPVYLHLPTFARDKQYLLDAISTPLVTRTEESGRTFYRRLLETGNCILLLDSLDEVSVEQKSAVLQQINDLCSQFPRAKVVVSCRTADYHQVLQGFSEVEISRLTREAVHAIVEAWFSSEPEKGARLLSLLDADKSMSAITETPLLLGLLCIQYRNDLALPKRKTELYRRCVDALLRDWDTTRGFRRDSQYSSLSDDRKEAVFESVAAAGFAHEIEYEYPEPSLLSAIADTIERFGISGNDARGILLEMESHHGIIEKCSAETYQFSHATMHEYFAARFYVASRQELSIVKEHYDDEKWHTVISFMCAILHDPAPVLEFLISKSSTENFQYYPTLGKRLTHLLLLYRCMSMGPSISIPLRQRICQHLVRSQINMLTRLSADGVLPYAARRQHGVRQTLFYYAKPRPSIEKLLQPYRSLMNEAFLSPVQDYVEQALIGARRLAIGAPDTVYPRLAAISCLLAPMADARPQEFLNWMFACSSELLKIKADNVRLFIVDSIAVHAKVHPGIEPDIDIGKGLAAMA
ncbi:NACHT domain-containing protein [Rubrivivax sp. JA1024]|nr:NACHT domain-containing protein [Rubrivivax sp. JA1024]